MDKPKPYSCENREGLETLEDFRPWTEDGTVFWLFAYDGRIFVDTRDYSAVAGRISLGDPQFTSEIPREYWSDLGLDYPSSESGLQGQIFEIQYKL